MKPSGFYVDPLSHDMEEKKKRMGIKKGVPLNSNLC